VKSYALIVLIALFPSAIRAQIAHVDLSKPLFTRKNAIICPIDSFLSPLAGHSYRDLMKMFNERKSGSRQDDAYMQNCDIYQAGVRFDALSADERAEAASNAESDGLEALANFLRTAHLVILEYFGDDPAIPDMTCCLVTRLDQVKNWHG
jgi:hypothetical protein